KRDVAEVILRAVLKRRTLLGLKVRSVLGRTMPRLWESVIHPWKARRFRRRVERVLALQARGEARPDGLELELLRNRLDLRWTERDVHPWDREVGRESRRRLFAEQVLADTEAVIDRCFAALPEIDAIELSVHD